MCWDKPHRCFVLQFSGVKEQLHDRLFLAFMTPKAVHIFEYAGGRGRRTKGVATEAAGEQICFAANGGKHGSRTWQAAERDLLKKKREGISTYCHSLSRESSKGEGFLQHGLEDICNFTSPGPLGSAPLLEH